MYKYAVVSEGNLDPIHDNIEDAIEEASQMVKDHEQEFVVVRLEKRVSLADPPVKVEPYDL